MSTAVPPSPDALAPWGEPTPRVRVRDALRHLMAERGWAGANWTVRQNLLLDEVGSDLRPLVALLVRAGEGAVAEHLPASRAGWPAARGALVVSLTAHSFLQPEMARWAVECWGYAAGVVDEGELTAAADARVGQWREAEARAALARAEAARADAARMAAERAAAERVVADRVTTGPRVAAARGGGTGALPASTLGTSISAPPVRAPGPSPLRGSGSASVPWSGPRAPARAAGVRRRGRLPEGLDNPVAHLSLVGIAVFMGYVVYSAVRLPSARASEVPRTVAVDVPPNGVPAAVAPTSRGFSPGIPGVTTSGLPQTAADSARMIRVVPARRPTYALEQGGPAGNVARAPLPVVPGGGGAPTAASPTPAPVTVAVPPPAPRRALPADGTPESVPAAPDGYDRLRLRDGRVIRGRVELVRVSAVVFRDAATGLRYEYPKADVDAVVTEFGSVVRFSPAEALAAGSPPAARAAARLVRRGVGGRYQVTFSVVSVNGSPECQRGWQTAPRPDWARVAHVPGADTLAVAFEGGATFASVIDEEAQFASTFVIVPDQAYSGQALTTRLNGRFAEGGFEAAVNVVGYRRVREGRDVACHTVLRAVGRMTR